MEGSLYEKNPFAETVKIQFDWWKELLERVIMATVKRIKQLCQLVPLNVELHSHCRRVATCMPCNIFSLTDCFKGLIRNHKMKYYVQHVCANQIFFRDFYHMYRFISFLYTLDYTRLGHVVFGFNLTRVPWSWPHTLWPWPRSWP